MYVKIFIDRPYATIAVQHALFYKVKVKSFKAFQEAIKTYTFMYGELCVDDHYGEYSEQKEQAKVIVEKYYK